MKRYRTKHGKMNSMYRSQKHNSKVRNHNMPEYTKEEFFEWLDKNDFSVLYEYWVDSGFKKSLSPSVDRKDSNKGYSFSNIKLMTWEENGKRAYSERKNGKLKTQHRPVLQFDLEFNFIAEYVSLREASRQTGAKVQNISLVCNNNQRRSTGGYIWKFKG